MTHSEALEVTLASDEVLSRPEHSAEVELARSLARQLDKQGDDPQSRTVASYSGVVGALRRIIRSAQAERVKQSAPPKEASRLSLIKQQSQKLAHHEEAA